MVVNLLHWWILLKVDVSQLEGSDISLTSEVYLLALVNNRLLSKLGIFKDWKGGCFACKPPSVLSCWEILFTVESGCISETIGLLKALKSVKYWNTYWGAVLFSVVAAVLGQGHTFKKTWQQVSLWPYYPNLLYCCDSYCFTVFLHWHQLW